MLSVVISNNVNAEPPDFPESIAIDSSGNVFVGIMVDATIGPDKIQKFTNNGKFIKQWEQRSAQGIAVDKSGNIFVLDRDDKRVYKYTNNDVYIRHWGNEGSGDGQFARPRGIEVDSSGNVYVVDGQNQNIQKFTNTGKFITKWKGNNLFNPTIQEFSNRDD